MNHTIILIRRWLMHTKVWRFVAFVSAVVGLVCYALSSSFNHLFGNWNLWKIILYTIFGFIISFMILYANLWNRSRSLRFKAHTAFLVLTITSVYTFFFDKVVNGKPDAYSLISCAAFSIMSMSLSRQSQCGFEVDLLYFFLGCLTVLLMKIKLPLVFVGAGFSYSLIIIRSYLSSINNIVENEYFGLQGENSVVIEMDSLIRPSNDFSVMMQNLMTCTTAIHQEISNLINRHIKEYILDRSKSFSRCDFVMDTLLLSKMHNLHEIVKLMIGAGYEKECSRAYSNWRKVFLQECLINKIFVLQDAKIKIENDRKREQYVDTMMGRLMTALDVTMTCLFPIEKQLCDRVFSGFSTTGSNCFIEVCQLATFQLLNLANSVGSGSPSKSCLLKKLDIFKQLHSLIPKFESLFPDSTLLYQAIKVKNKLGEASRDLFKDMHNFIFKVPETDLVDSSYGQHHQMTIEVMSYVTSVCRSKRTLEQILHEYSKVDNEVEASSFFVKQIEQIIGMLEKKLIYESENYKDLALRHIFMLNNRSHIEAVNKSWELETILGNEWFQNNIEKIHKNHELYKGSSWNKVVDFLKLENNENTTEELLKEKIHLFNSHFEDICRVQSVWSVYDNKLREEIISSVGKILLPAYGIFVGRLQDILGNQAYKYIKYELFEIQDLLNHLFLGNQNI
ncbi:exocyst complex component EXO70B1-like [Trifolium pratense]|uniref:exocyst complex component EXO70B1-like n=1 Tax=Trifolium pratense TaxID=57577 RepID=UPI001E697442|nr:exocyst complex component EXO70B1-like [Trifolium pratense]